MSHIFFKLISSCIFIFLCIFGFSAEETFFMINGRTNEKMMEFGPKLHERISPCSTFKITLSLIGYDAEILKTAEVPIWEFQEGYDDGPQTPQSWMSSSCIWFSKVLALQLGVETIKEYLALLEYGNEDLTGGFPQPGFSRPAWIHSSLKISPYEQVHFLQKMIQGTCPFSSHAVTMTKRILFREELPNGWQLFGKTGWSGSVSNEADDSMEYSWFIGWIEKDTLFFPFAYLICDKKIDLEQRIPRVKQLILQSF
jgi:beta-lactamase class D